MATKTEPVHAGEFIASEANGTRSRGVITLLSGQNLPAGAVIGQIIRGAAGSAAAGDDNVGNGAFSAVTVSAGVKPGTYRATAIDDDVNVTAGAVTVDYTGATAGSGTFAATPTKGVDAKPGVYKLTIIEPGTNAGKFILEDPDGIEVGTGTVAVAFASSHLNFTLQDATDFVAGDIILITVAEATSVSAAKFLVEDPDGIELGVAVVGTEFSAGGVTFTISDGSANFKTGDTFTFEIAEGSGKYKLVTTTATDGSQVAAAVLFDAADATDGDVECVAILRDAELSSDNLDYGALNAGQITTANAQLAQKGIIVLNTI